MTPLAKNNLAAPDIRLDYRGSLISGVSFMSISSIVFKKWEEGGGGGGVIQSRDGQKSPV